VVDTLRKSARTVAKVGAVIAAATVVLAAGCGGVRGLQGGPVRPASLESSSSPSVGSSSSTSDGSASTQPSRQAGGAAVFTLVAQTADTAWLSIGDQLMATADGGKSWAPVYTAPGTITAVDAVSSSVAVMAAGTEILTTMNGGRSWSVAGTVPRLSQPAASVFIAPQVGDYVVSTPDDPVSELDFVSPMVGWALEGSSLIATDDGGVTWTPVSTPAPVHSACLSTQADGFIGSGRRVWQTIDGGTTWRTALTVPRPGISVMYVECDGNEATWAFVSGPATPQGVPDALYRTTNGTTWKAVVDSSVSEQWAKAPRGANYPVALAAPSAEAAYLVTQYPIGHGGYRVGRTTDGGQSWVAGSQLLPDGITPYPDNGPVRLAFPSVTDGWLVARQGASLVVLTTTNGGTTWQEVHRFPLA